MNIQLWYGQEQYFGQHGRGLPFINVLGNVSPAKYIAELTYSLNGDLPFSLNWGPDYRRLAHAGDFNVEIDTIDLAEGKNLLKICAQDRRGGQVDTEVVIHYQSSAPCTLPYVVDWEQVHSIQESAHVVDGWWELRDGQVRPKMPGYDRVIGLGDISWEDYQVTVPLTLHGYDPAGVNPTSVGFNVGLVIRWKGHADWDGSQPRHGYYPVGALALYEHNINDPRDFRLRLYGNQMFHLTEGDSDKKLKNGVTYLFKASVQSRSGLPSYYRMKVWEASLPEPGLWDLEGPGVLAENKSGSLLLLAHHTDVSFGAVKVEAI